MKEDHYPSSIIYELVFGLTTKEEDRMLHDALEKGDDEHTKLLHQLCMKYELEIRKQIAQFFAAPVANEHDISRKIEYFVDSELEQLSQHTAAGFNNSGPYFRMNDLARVLRIIAKGLIVEREK